ncbi:MAG: rRNA maturation RNase YbeY [bacterium]|nr:rRNA maturation RNase YbeY [bacterium]
MKPTTARSEKKILLINRQKKVNLQLDYIDSGVCMLEKIIPISVKKINIVLVSDRHIINLNKQFLNKKHPTDVLAFKIDSTAEIVISVETARRQAKQFCHRTEEEILYLIIHGILHISGFNDNSPNNYGKMKRRQDNIFYEILKHVTTERKEQGCG